MNKPAGETKISRIDSRSGTADWLAVPFRVHADDPAWIPQLNLLEKQRISRKRAPFFSFGEAEFFVAYRNGKPVGRISAHINRRHLDVHRDASGHFGFFECTNDGEAAQALVDAAAAWLRPQGMHRMVGPLSFSTNEECGCLIAGFDTPPAMLMPHHRVWTQNLLEACGMGKEIDLLAYRTTPQSLPPRIEKLAGRAERMTSVSLRFFDMRRYDEEIELLVDIFNDAWSEAWGFVPFSPREIASLANELRPFFRADYGRFLLVDGEAVGVAVAIPDLNGIIAPFRGRLFPLNWAKLLWTLRRETWRSARIPLMGLRRAYHATPRGGALVIRMVKELVIQAHTKYNIDWAEYSWVRETDTRMVALAEAIAGPPVKRYRIYAKAI